MTTLLICHPQRLIREAWISFFAACPGITVVGDTDTHSRSIDLCRSLHPKVAIVATDLVGLTDIKQFNTLNTAAEHTHLILVCTRYPGMVSNYLHRIGTRGFISMNSTIAEMQTAVRRVNSGAFYISGCFDREAEKRPDAFASKLSLLTKKEWEVLSLLLEGKTSKDIATLLGASCKTVDVHRYHLLQKLDCHKTVHVLNRLNAAFK